MSIAPFRHVTETPNLHLQPQRRHTQQFEKIGKVALVALALFVSFFLLPPEKGLLLSAIVLFVVGYDFFTNVDQKPTHQPTRQPLNDENVRRNLTPHFNEEGADQPSSSSAADAHEGIRRSQMET